MKQKIMHVKCKNTPKLGIPRNHQRNQNRIFKKDGYTWNPYTKIDLVWIFIWSSKKLLCSFFVYLVKYESEKKRLKNIFPNISFKKRLMRPQFPSQFIKFIRKFTKISLLNSKKDWKFKTTCIMHVGAGLFYTK
jgi:hypothetical protein